MLGHRPPRRHVATVGHDPTVRAPGDVFGSECRRPDSEGPKRGLGKGAWISTHLGAPLTLPPWELRGPGGRARPPTSGPRGARASPIQHHARPPPAGLRRAESLRRSTCPAGRSRRPPRCRSCVRSIIHSSVRPSKREPPLTCARAPGARRRAATRAHPGTRADAPGAGRDHRANGLTSLPSGDTTRTFVPGRDGAPGAAGTELGLPARAPRRGPAPRPCSRRSGRAGVGRRGAQRRGDCEDPATAEGRSPRCE